MMDSLSISRTRSNRILDALMDSLRWRMETYKIPLSNQDKTLEYWAYYRNASACGCTSEGNHYLLQIEITSDKGGKFKYEKQVGNYRDVQRVCADMDHIVYGNVRAQDLPEPPPTDYSQYTLAPPDEPEPAWMYKKIYSLDQLEDIDIYSLRIPSIKKKP